MLSTTVFSIPEIPLSNTVFWVFFCSGCFDFFFGVVGFFTLDLGLEIDFLRDSLEVVLLALDRRRFLWCVLFCVSSSVSSSLSGFWFPVMRKENV